MKNQIQLGDVVWMVNGTRKLVVSFNTKSLTVEGDIKIPMTRINRQHKTGILLEIQDGVKNFR